MNNRHRRVKRLKHQVRVARTRKTIARINAMARAMNLAAGEIVQSISKFANALGKGGSR